MVKATILLIEASGIQNYIFGSNHLAQNIGASEIVYRSTTEWLYQQLQRLNVSSNIDRFSEVKGLILNSETLLSVDAEIVYANGGNAFVLFQDREKAKQVVQKLTRQIYENARGLKGNVALGEVFDYDPKNNDLQDQHADVRALLSQKKATGTSALPLGGLSVTSTCVYTGQVAIGGETDSDVVGEATAQRFVDRGDLERGIEPRRISKEVAHKLRYEHKAKKRLEAILPRVNDQNGYEFVMDFGHFGVVDDSSYIAVIHADGNRMGDRFIALTENVSSNEEYIDRLRDLSAKIAANSLQALQATVDVLIDSIEAGQLSDLQISKPDPSGKKGKKKVYLPFRPLVFGGDDVTFVADGRLGLELAAEYVKQFTQLELPGGPVYARAGVAIVKTHYPFSRAYELADELSSSAKKAIDQFVDHPEKESANVIDWHYSTTGIIFNDLNELREREFSADDGSLLMRPLHLDDHSRQWKAWGLFKHLVDTFRNQEEWSGKKNKVYALRNSLRTRNEYPLFLTNYRLGGFVSTLALDVSKDLEGKKGLEQMAAQGWAKRDMSDSAEPMKTAYHDPIEALDYYYPIGPTHAPKSAETAKEMGDK
ncbi:MAG: hypothetical protein AAF902_12275 [Chloroflexota bacterium]